LSASAAISSIFLLHAQNLRLTVRDGLLEAAERGMPSCHTRARDGHAIERKHSIERVRTQPMASVLVSRYAATAVIVPLQRLSDTRCAQIGRSQSRCETLWCFPMKINSRNESWSPSTVAAWLPRCGAVEVIVTFRGSVNVFMYRRKFLAPLRAWSEILQGSLVS
jgi:hypothetical protein